MGNRFIFEAIDRTLQDIRKDSRLFGGRTVVFTGDLRGKFCQLFDMVAEKG